MLFCLVIRNAYQGKQFEILRLDLNPRNVETIDEMIEKNFTIYVFESHIEFYKDMDFMKR